MRSSRTEWATGASYERLAGANALASGHEDLGIALPVSTDHDRIAAELGRVAAMDPIRHTLLGTIRSTLEHPAWMSWHADGLAVRSRAYYPIAIAGEWPAALRDELIGQLRELPDLREVSGPAEIEDRVIIGLD